MKQDTQAINTTQYSALHTDDSYEASDKDGFFPHPSDKDLSTIESSTGWCCAHYSHALHSDDPRTRRRAQFVVYGGGGCCILLSIAVVLLFTVILPAIMRSLVHRSSLSLVSATLSQPTDDSFSSSVVEKFGDLGTSSSLAASARMHAITVSWLHSDNNNAALPQAYTQTQRETQRETQQSKDTILVLSPQNTLSIANNREVTMNALATVSDVQAMSDFTISLITAQTVQWAIDTSLSLTFLGVTTSTDCHKTLSLSGFNNFSVPPIIHNTNVTAGTPLTVSFVSDVSLFSQSNVEMDLGQSLCFHLVVDGVDIGIGELPHFVMHNGEIDVIANFTATAATPEQYDAICYLMSQYSTGRAVEALMTNFFLRDAPIAWLSPALQTITMQTSLPGCEAPLVQLIYLYMKPVPENLPYALQLYNPQPLPLIVSSIQGSLYYLGVKIAIVNNQGLNIVVPPYTVITTEKLVSTTVNTPAAAKAFSKFMEAGQGPVDLDAVIVGNFSEFRADIKYVQSNVTMVLA